MKLRLRALEAKEILKIEVSNLCSLQQLKQILSQKIPSCSSLSSSIHLSLNRSDELLSSSPEDSLQSLGITSGDLIFFTFNPNGFSSDTPLVQCQSRREPRSNETQISPQTLNLEPNSHKEENPDSDSLTGENRGSDAQKEKALELNPHKEKAVVSDSQEGKTFELTTQMGENIDIMEDDDDDESVVEVGKSFSVPGFLKKVFTEELGDDSGGDHKLFVIAIHAILLESGFVGFNPVMNVAFNGFHLPDEWPSAAFMMSLCYTLPEIIDLGQGYVNGIDTVVLKFQNLGKFLNVYGSLANGSGTHWVRLDEDHMVPFLNVVWSNCGLVDEISGQYGFSGTTSPEKEVFKFWRIVKDRLALPLLIDLCEKAGLELPPCFTRLPTELKLKILESLPGVDLAKVTCVCPELRYLASSDDLWKQKFVEQFGNTERSEGGGSRWKEKFAKSWESRKKTSSIFLRRRRRDPHQFRFLGDPPFTDGEYAVWPHYGIGPGVPEHPRRRNPFIRFCNLGGTESM